MKLACGFAVLLLMNCTSSWAQVGIYVGAYYPPAPVFVNPNPVVVVAPAPVVQMSYVPQRSFVYSAPVASPVYVQPAPVVAPVTVVPQYPVAFSPLRVAARETVRPTLNGINYDYREYGPLGAQRFHYSVHSRPHGYVVREHGR